MALDRRRASTAVCTVAIIAILTLGSFQYGSPQATASTSPVSSNFFGITIQGSNDQKNWPSNQTQIGILGKVDGAHWVGVEYTRGNYNWAVLDDSIKIAESRGITIFMYTFRDPPPFAKHCPNGDVGDCASSINITDFHSFVTHLVNRYKGTIEYYEIWNEPNYNFSWRGTPAQLVLVANDAYNTIKKLDPNATVLGPGIGLADSEKSNNTWLDRYLQAGGDKYLDTIDWHGYSCFKNQACGEIECTQEIQCAGIPLISEIKNIRAVAMKNGLGSKPLWDTEGGTQYGPPGDRGRGQLNDTNEQYAYISRWFIIQASEGVSTAVWYQWQEQGRNTFQPKSLPAYIQTYNWLVGSTISPCSYSKVNSSSSDVLWTCALTQPNGNQAQIVFGDSNSTTISFQTSQYAYYQDLSGNTYPINGPISLGDKPILLMTSGPTSSSSTSTSTSSASSSSSSSSVSTSSSSTTRTQTESSATQTSSTTNSSITTAGSLPWAYLAALPVIAVLILAFAYHRTRSKRADLGLNIG